MTIIKQTGVQSNGHMKNLRGYINDDRKVLVRDSLNMDGCTNPKRWAHHMWMTREMYGHNKSARRVRDKKTGELKDAKNTVLYHQILGFNPDECDLNGGRLSPEDCMRYAKLWRKLVRDAQKIAAPFGNIFVGSKLFDGLHVRNDLPVRGFRCFLFFLLEEHALKSPDPYLSKALRALQNPVNIETGAISR